MLASISSPSDMNKTEYFFLIFFLTVFIVRVFLYIRPTPGPTISGFRIHHYMIGLALMPIGYLITNLVIYAVGLGLFIDELTYVLISGKNHKDNYSIISLSGTAVFVILIYLLREKLVF